MTAPTFESIPEKRVPDIDRCINKYIYDQTFSAAACMASIGANVFHRASYGTLLKPPPLKKTQPGVLFDLASLTQPLATGLAALYLVSRSRMDLGAPLSTTLPEFRTPIFEKITLDMLLDHTSGLAPMGKWAEKVALHDAKTSPADRLMGTPKAIDFLKNQVAASQPTHEPGKRFLYSQAGPMILGWVIEHITGKRLDDFLMREIYRPLGLHEQLFFIRLDDLRARSFLRRRAFAAMHTCEWRDKLIQGEVSDDTAWAMGGVAGHAGLFGTVEAVWLILYHLWASYKGIERTFLAGAVRRFWTPSRRIRGLTRTLGWDTPTVNQASCGKRFSRNSIGEVGNGGSSIWLDLSSDVFGVVLTNQKHMDEDSSRDALATFRPRVYELISKEGESLPPDATQKRGSAAF